MKIIDRYLIYRIVRYTAIILFAAVALFVIIDFFQKFEKFVKADVPFALAVSYFINMAPLLVVQITPLSFLLAVMIILGLMSKHNEIVALRAGGVSIYRLVRPILLTSVAMSLFMFALAELVIPYTAAKANRIWLHQVRKKPLVTTRSKDIWLKGNRSVLHINYYQPKSDLIQGVTLNRFDRDFRLIYRIDAAKGVYQGEEWLLQDLMEQQWDETRQTFQSRYFEAKMQALDLKPADLAVAVKKSEEMNIFELFAYVGKVEGEGYDATRYKVDLFGKVAYPLVCVIMGLVGAGIAGRGRIREGLPVSIAWGLGIAFLYWIFNSFCMSLGYGGVLPAVLAAGAADFIFGCFGLYSLLHAE